MFQISGKSIETFRNGWIPAAAAAAAAATAAAAAAAET
jgi:hypothetical protein